MNMIYRETLKNGLRIVGETMENYRSVSVGVWIGAGSVFERTPAEAGVSHFIEHMLFKGTYRRSAADIAEEIDSVGGNLNAFTSKECTCFYVKVLEENLPAALDILADLVCNSKFDPSDIEREKGVVLEEIAMNEDSPEDLAHEELCKAYYSGDRLAMPVLGNAESVGAFTRDTLTGCMNQFYKPDNMVISAAGCFDPARFRELVENAFTITGKAEKHDFNYGSPAGERSFNLFEKDVEQTHICLGFPGFAAESDGQYPLYMLNNAVGGSMSSRLFQSIREKRGMAYSVYSAPSFYRNSGYFTLYAGTGEKQTAEVLKLMLDEYSEICKKGITLSLIHISEPTRLVGSEMCIRDSQMKTGYLLGRENTSAHSSAIGRTELMGTDYLSEEEIIRRIDAVTLDDIRAILPTVCDFSKMTAVFVGRTAEYAQELEDIIRGRR